MRLVSTNLFLALYEATLINGFVSQNQVHQFSVHIKKIFYFKTIAKVKNVCCL